MLSGSLHTVRDRPPCVGRPTWPRLIAARVRPLALAIAFVVAPHAAHAQVTWTGTAANANWGTAGAWSGAGLANNFNSALVFQGTNLLSNTNTLTGGTAAGITFSAGSGAFLISGSDFTLNGTISNSSSNLQTIANNITLGSVQAVSGSSVTLSGTITATNGNRGITNNVSSGALLTLGSINLSTGNDRIFTLGGTGNTTITGSIFQTGANNGLTVTNSGTTTLTGVSNWTGQTTVGGGTLSNALIFGGAAGANSGVSTYVLQSGRLILDNTGAGNNNLSRIADTSAIQIGAGSFIFRGSDQASTTSTETVGAITYNPSNGVGGVITVTYGGSNLATLTAASLGYTAGYGSLLVNGQNLGKNSTDTGSVGKLILTAAPTLVGTTDALTSGINSSAKNTKIVPYLVGEATSTTGGLGTATGTANTFLTYVAGAGLRPLNPTDEFTTNAISSGNNTYLTAATTNAASTAAINSLVLNGGNISIADGATLTNTSGAILFASSNAIVPQGTTGALSFGNNQEAVITINPGVTGTIATAITPNGTNNVTYSGSGTLAISGNNSYTGTTYVNPGLNLVLGNRNVFGSGTVTLNQSNTTGTTTLQASTNLTGVNAIPNYVNFNLGNTTVPSPTLVAFTGTNSIEFSGTANQGNNGNFNLVNNLASSATLTFSNAVSMASGKQMYVYGSGNTTLSGTISSNNGVFLASSGTTTLSGANAGTAGVSLGTAASGSGGIYVIGNANAFGTGTVTINQPVSVQTASALSFANNLTLGNNPKFAGSNSITVTGTTTQNFGRNITNNLSSGSLTFSGPVSLSASNTPYTLTIAGSGNTTLSGSIVNGGTGAGGLTVTNTGTTTLSGLSSTAANNYTGATTIDNGRLVLSSAGTAALSGGLIFGGSAASTNAGSLDLTNANASFGSLTVQTNNASGTNTITIGNGKTLTTNGNVAIGVTNPTANSTTLLNVTGSGGAWIVNSSGGSFRVGLSTAITKNEGASVNLSGLGSFTANLGSAGTFRVGNGSVDGVNNSTLTLASGTNTITAGTLGIGDGTKSANTLNLGANATNTLNANTILVGPVSGQGGSNTLQFSGAGSGSVKIRAADQSSAAALTMATAYLGTGIVYSQVFDVTGHAADLLFSTVDILNPSAASQPQTATFSFDSGTVTAATFKIGTRGAVSVGAGTPVATANIGSSSNLANAFSLGAVQIAQTSGTVGGITGSLNIRGNATSGTITSLSLGGASAAGGTSNATLSITGGTTTLLGDITVSSTVGTVNSTLTLNGGVLDMSGSSIGGANRIGTLNFQSGELRNVREINAGLTGLTKTTSGTLVLAGTNAYTGATTISAGILSFGGTSALQGTSGVTITGGAGLTYTGGADTFAKNVTITAGSGTGTIRNSGGGLLTLSGNLSKDNSILRLTGGRFNVTGTISGATPNASDLLVDGTSSVTLSAVNTYNGPTFVNQSSNLILGIDNAIPNNSVLTLGNATTTGTLALGSFSDSIAQLIFSGSGGTLAMAAATTASVQLVTGTTLTLGSNAQFDLTGSGTTAGLYRLVSASSITGTFASVIGLDSNYVLRYGTVNANEIDAQRKADQAFTMTTGGVTRALVNTTVAVSGSITNSTPTGGANLAVSLATGGALTVGNLASGTNSLAPQGSTAVSGSIQTGNTVGNQTWSVINTDNSAITTSSTASGSITVVNQRTFTSPSTINLGRVLIGASAVNSGTVTSTALSGTTASSTLQGYSGSAINGLSLTGGNVLFNGVTTSAAYSLSGSVTGTAGNAIGGTFNLSAVDEFGNTVTNAASVAYTGTAIQNRTYTSPSTINLGRVLINAVASGSAAVTSSQSYETTATGTLGSSSGGAINGVSLTGAGGVFNGTNTSATYSLSGNVSGTAGQSVGGTFFLASTNEFGATTGSAASVSFAATTVAQRSFSLSSGTINLGNFLRTGSVTGSATVSSSGLNATTANASLLTAFTGTNTNGFSLATLDSTNFNGGTLDQSALYTLSGSAASAGSINGTFTSAVSAELGAIDPVTVSLVGTAYDPAIASFTDVSATTSRFVYIGEFNQNTGDHTAGFSIFNLFTGDQTYAADLMLLSITDIGTPSGSLSTNLAAFNNLAAGKSNNWTATLSSLTTGSFTNQYQLNFVSAKNGQSLGGPQSMTLTVTGIIVVPEPGALALAGIGVAAAAWCVRRRQHRRPDRDAV